MSRELQFVCVFLCLLLIGFLITRRRPARNGNQLLIGLLCVLAVHIGGQLLAVDSVADGGLVARLVQLCDDTCGLVYGPVFCGFLAALVNGRPTRRTDAIHLIPFCLVVVLRGFRMIGGETALALVFASIGSYLLHAARLLWGAWRRPSDRRIPLSLVWPTFSLAAFAGAYVIDVLGSTIAGASANTSRALSISLFALLSLWLAGFVLAGLGAPGIYEGSPMVPLHESPALPPAMPDIDHATLRRIERLLVDDKHHLRPQLTLAEFARAAGLAPRRLSMLINRGCAQTFADWVNERRVEEARRLLAGREGQVCTMLEVMERSGFNSKSTFNAVFKAKTGLAPTAYRDRVVSPGVRKSAPTEIRSTDIDGST